MGIDFRVFWAADINNVNRFYVAGQRSPADRRRHTKILKNSRYIVIGVDSGVIWAADFDSRIR